ncbi:group-specific protein [Ammoniphilus sp. CFH 90114]|uniref:group-specific protein n=1 Tax=Ammoniphilus sp. CFH 90114 TaxID=2493665 RepID=UPI00100F1EEC|nr:group-specific protein [Ammoniphilus sp. CFH 90114]RXT14942.1 group-specific protein [Ammoniphilus sp. CFH 90114]
MGICMKDHPSEDVLEKIEAVKEQLEASVLEGLLFGLENQKWDQAQLNELFHALKKLEKRITNEERTATLDQIVSFLD